MQQQLKNCPRCNHPGALDATVCTGCGQPFNNKFASALDVQSTAPGSGLLYQQYPVAGLEGKSKVAAGAMAILFPYLGLHGFYIGNSKLGITVLLWSLATLIAYRFLGFAHFLLIPDIAMIHVLCSIQGILYLTSTKDEFYNKYIIEKRWF